MYIGLASHSVPLRAARLNPLQLLCIVSYIESKGHIRVLKNGLDNDHLVLQVRFSIGIELVKDMSKM